tara:strand:+ start:472 stop:843 length:372 start_codon:yes stop_codon:yes gene_type:complete
MESISDSSDDNDCWYCGKIMKHSEDNICDECLDSTIKYWSCNRCGNTWSPDYCDERNYSDCCMGMMECNNTNIDIDIMNYCRDTWETVYDNNKICKGCMEEKLPQCKKLIKAYTKDKCKLKDY